MVWVLVLDFFGLCLFACCLVLRFLCFWYLVVMGWFAWGLWCGSGVGLRLVLFFLCVLFCGVWC